MNGRSACTASWVASPRRGLNITQPIPEFAGRDFWLLLGPKWHELAGVKDEAFVQDSGVWHALAYDGLNVSKIAGPKADGNAWTHLGMTWSEFTARFYVNGEEVEGALGPFKTMAPLGVDGLGSGKFVFRIGSQNPRHYNIHAFSRQIDEVKLHNRALTPEETKAAYRDPAPGGRD